MLRRARHYHDHGPRSEKHMPSFLKEVPSEARKEFFKIVHDRKSPRSEVQQRVKAWAEKQGGSVLKDLRNFDAKKKAHFAEIHKNVSLVISQLESAHAKVSVTHCIVFKLYIRPQLSDFGYPVESG
ncbi:hypothetical protein OESDEN_21143 [Oesophagostomum dentatum]|uniref:SXP/RAL-2 family protein Ani s 5-like cation-binding domain-containing protein n=1 Tax=Oesophagostomum dentatum TaxID=61180 RepID=A0A0B1S6U8_OESDE|nr:hypothetical protein OESDEN_21143 [Oesophagostomum dentatum]